MKNKDFYSYEPNNEFREHIGDIIRDLEGQLLLKGPMYWNQVIKQWFSKNFEQLHIKTSISDIMLLDLKDAKKYEEYQDEYALNKIAHSLNNYTFKTKLDYPRDEFGKIINDYHKEKTHSIIVMKNKK